MSMNMYRLKIRLLNQQYNLFAKNEVELKSNLISLLDQTYPGASTLFGTDKDQKRKWVNFIASFWHVDLIAGNEQEAFLEKYQAWCEKHGYSFEDQEAHRIFTDAKTKNANLPKDTFVKSMMKDALTLYNEAAKAADRDYKDLCAMVKQLPEYDTVMSIVGKEKFAGVQLIAEMGDIRRFKKIDSLRVFAGVASTNDSEKKKDPDAAAPKIRKLLIKITEGILKDQNPMDPIMSYMKTKFSEGKPYYIVVQAGGRKFLDIYYSRVKECLNTWDSI